MHVEWRVAVYIAADLAGDEKVGRTVRRVRSRGGGGVVGEGERELCVVRERGLCADKGKGGKYAWKGNRRVVSRA